nr:CbiX/SirB N-terminal domain-containing protein [Cellulomonas sp. IC4_254]
MVACAHGTRSAAGRAVVRALVEDVRRLRPGLEVREAFVDVQEPAVGDAVGAALAGAQDGLAAVVAPLLLSTGVHVRHDIGAAVAGRPAVAAEPLGPDDRLAGILVERLTDAGATADDAVVLAAAGSSDPAAVVAVGTVLDALRVRWPGPVTVGYGAAARPDVATAVAEARATGARRVVVASYLLAPGHFHGALAAAGADVVTAPLGPHPDLARVVLDRYDAALR